MKRVLLIAAISFASITLSYAQNSSGILLNKDIISASSFLSLSQRESVGTARSMGMGGAFTSLGADMASFGYNPAGFGMYQNDEISVSFGLGVRKAKNYNAYNTGDNSAIPVSINNMGASFNIYEGTGKLLSVNFALGYNKVADFNYDMGYEGLATVSSLADAFSDIANGGRLGINSNNKITDPNGYYDYDMNPYYWGTVMAYKAGLINQGTNGWYPDEIAPGAQMTQLTTLSSRGSVGEYSFAMGFNVSNVFYFGASLDIQSISRTQTIYYDEYINYAKGETPNPSSYPYQLKDFQFDQKTKINGSGIGAKFGIVIRPAKGFRMGFAIHTPTYYSLVYSYAANLSSCAVSAGDNPYGWEVINGHVYANERTPKLLDNGGNRWRFTTPTRLLAGLSLSVGQFALFSADYQYDAYRALKLLSAPADPGYTNDAFRSNLKGVHTVRAGIEAKFVPWLSLRLGGGYRTQVLNKNFDDKFFSEPVANGNWYASAGIGFRLGKVTSIDLAYQYTNTRYTDYYSYYTKIGANANHSPIYGLDILSHNIALTFAFRF